MSALQRSKPRSSIATESWTCKKRSGRITPFDSDKIRSALRRCFTNSECDLMGVPEDVWEAKIVWQVVNSLVALKEPNPDVELVQRIVIQQLWASGLFEAAEHYQNYRQARKQARLEKPIPPEVASRFAADQQHFPTDLQYYQFQGKFARWRESDKRRETWRECVSDRVIPWLCKLPLVRGKLSEQEIQGLDDAMFNLQASPAMRVVQMAGPALDRCHVGCYNCSYAPISDMFALPELLYILMQGTGAGFSVESDYIGELPKVKKQRGKARDSIYVEDSTEGWCDAFYQGLQRWWDGHDVDFDTSGVRQANTRLKTKGGRASGPGPFLELMTFARNIILARQGKYLEDTDVHRLACFTGRIVQVGGVRRAATISLSDVNSRGMRDIKSGNWYNDSYCWSDGKYLTMSNNSAVYQERPTMDQFMDEWWALVKSKSGERGIFNRQANAKHKPARRKRAVFGVNPCIVGNTLVAVADGRGSVPIAQLAKEKKDVPVYCYDRDSQLTVRWMRHPRVTGVDVPIYKITLDSGATVRVTKKHKFRMRKGHYLEAYLLKPGDCLATLSAGKVGGGRVMLSSRDGEKYESRLIGEFYAGRELMDSEHVHHKNGIKDDNRPENLEVVQGTQHLQDHATGPSNPNSIGKTNDELLMLGRQLTKSLGRRFSTGEWEEFARHNGLPLTFSGWRQKSLGDKTSFAKRCAALEGLSDISDADPRTQRKYLNALKAGLNAELVNKQVIVHKKCEGCGDNFSVDYSKREICYCGLACYLRDPKTINSFHKKSAKTFKRKKELLRVRQIEVYLQIKEELGRDPILSEWRNACKLAGVRGTIYGKSAPFQSFPELKEAVALSNHKVVSVELDGYEDVYNGTVDDFHNFFVGGWKEVTSGGRDKTVWINNAQCGEIVLRPHQFCNLSIVIARPDDTVESLKAKVRHATLFGIIQSTATDFRYIRSDFKQNCEEERLLGVDITGHADCPLLRYGAPGRAELLRELGKEVKAVKEIYSPRFGIPFSAADTCVKPSGDSAVFFNCGSGVSPWFAEYIMRWVREPKDSPIAKFLIDSGVPHAPAPEAPDRLLVFGFPRKAPEGSTKRNDLPAIAQLENWLEWKKEWAEHSVSATIYVDDHEWLDVGAWVYKEEHWDHVSGLSFLPKDNGVYSYAPNEELTKEQYDEAMLKFPRLSWAKLQQYEEEDSTESAQTFACVNGACELG